MKKQLLFFLLLISAVGSAQVVDIPDANFKNKLLEASTENDIAKDINNINMTIDVNEDGEIQVSEAEAVYSLHTDDAGITSLTGLEDFVNLKVFWIRGNPLTSIDVSFLANLEELNVNGQYYGDASVLTSLNLSGLVNLKSVAAPHNHLSSLDITGLQNLEVLSCGDNGMVSLQFGNNSNLKTLDVSENNFTSLPLTSLTGLERLYVKINPLTSLSLEDCVSLKELYCDLTPIQNLDISSCTFLEKVECGGTEEVLLESVIVGELPELVVFWCDMQALTELDFSGCPSLEGLNCFEISNEMYINMKNGGNSAIALSFEDEENDTNIFICVDEDEELNFPASILQNTNIHISSYCSFTPGGNYNTITGNFTFDGDDNGCDTDDSFGAMVKVNINDGTESGSAFSNNNGSYNFYTESGTFTLTPQFENDWFTITPSSATITFEDDSNNVENQNFCVTANGEHPDVEAVIVPTVPAQPGFNASYKITYRNKGNQTVSGNVFLTYDETVLDYVSSTSGVAASTNTFGWSYTDLQPFETRNIYLTLKVNAPTDTPAVNIDDMLMFTANVTTEADNDENSDDNTFVLAQTVVGSYDPNDITCLEGEAIHVDKIGDYLHYNINFENTGTAPATFVVVKNEINEEQFDISTLQLMDASHNVETRMTGNTIEFYFGDINLAANGGKGNVLFKIKTLDTLQEDDIVMQQANIYFDYNFPIETNEANTTFATLSNTVFTKDNSVTLYPNPSKDIVNIKANATITSVQLYDVQGRLLQTKKVNDVDVQLDISVQPSGLYFVKIATENGAKVEKLVKE